MINFSRDYDEENTFDNYYENRGAQWSQESQQGFDRLGYRHKCKTKKDNGHIVKYRVDKLICCRNCKRAWESIKDMVDDDSTYQS